MANLYLIGTLPLWLIALAILAIIALLAASTFIGAMFESPMAEGPKLVQLVELVIDNSAG